MRVLFVSAEIFPLAKTGGLADVCAALPLALANLGVDVHLLLPGYPEALEAAANKSQRAELGSCRIGGIGRLIEARTPDSSLPVWLVDCPSLYRRPGGLYQDQDGADWPDNARRFGYLNGVAAGLASGKLLGDWQPDVVHGNDWHTGLLPMLLSGAPGARPATLFTIHNLAYQGLFAMSVFSDLGLSVDLLTPDSIEFYGQLSFLKAGIRYADQITTVSPCYAREIITPEYGCGLDGLLRWRSRNLSGILNGVDYRIWDPGKDAYLPSNFHQRNISGKRACKAELQRELGLAPTSDVPLVVWVSRLTDQKMADLVLEALPAILNRNLQFALLGRGDPSLEQRFEAAARQYAGRFVSRIGYEEGLAHRFYAGGDILLHPSRFEPCGLTPLYALRYGTLPIARRTGGLVDTIVDADEATVRNGTATGFVFQEPSGRALIDCLDRAIAYFDQPVIWRKLQRRAMSRDFSWDRSARRYLSLYRALAPHVLPAAAGAGGDIGDSEHTTVVAAG